MRWWERVAAWDDAHRFAVDAAWTGAALLLVLALAPTIDATGASAALPWSFALVAPLAWRRTHPAASAALVMALAGAHLLTGAAVLLPADLAVLVALHSVTVHGPRWAYRTAVATALLGAAMVGLALGGGLGGSVVVGVVVASTSLAVFALALVRRSRRETIEALVDRARRLEVERDQQAQIATAAERTRIAREMHDIVAHSLSVMVAQADGGRYAGQSDPAAATRSLETIAETGRAAMTDMRRLLGVLRPAEPGVGHPADTPGRPAAPRAPQPSGIDLDPLLDQVREAGLRVAAVRTGTPRPLPPGVGLAVHRICQEALTNVLRHAGPAATVTVLTRWAPDSLVLDVADDGRGAAATGDGAGQGLRGMAERAAMLGGSLTSGPRPGGGFRVRATIPLPPPHQEIA